MGLFVLATPVTASAPIEPRLTSKEEMVAYATKMALEARISPATVLSVIGCESSWVPDARGDSGHSRGLVQIFDTYHPHISDEEADDPAFAIRYLVSEIKQGNGNAWTCFRNL